MDSFQLNTRPGGFWIRLVATIIDGIIIGVAQWIVIIPLMFLMKTSLTDLMDPTTPKWGFQIMSNLVWLVFTALYYAYFYSKKGSSPGKMLFKMKVINSSTGQYLTPGRAALRETIGKLISGFTLLIGFIMAAFRSDKKALHDLIAGSQVLVQRK